MAGAVFLSNGARHNSQSLSRNERSAMNMMIWILAGAVIGWASFAYLKFSEGRGMPASVGIGATGGFVGGKLLAPLLGFSAAPPGDFSAAALLLAFMAAAGLLFIGDQIHARYGF